MTPSCCSSPIMAGIWVIRTTGENRPTSRTPFAPPLIISAPGFKSGRACGKLVEYVDLYPTLCELAGITVPDYLEGNSVVPLLRDPSRPWKNSCLQPVSAWISEGRS